MWRLFAHQFVNMFTVLLFVAGVLSLITYFIDIREIVNLVAACALFIIIIFMAIVGFLEERKSIRVISGFAAMIPQQCTAIRAGRTVQLNTEHLVNGDIVLLRNGARIPADLRIIQCVDLKCETSAMTGESEPIEMTATPCPEYVSPMDSHCIAFNSSLVLDGEGVGVVIRTGDHTFIGRCCPRSLTRSCRQPGASHAGADARPVEHVARDHALRALHRRAVDHDGGRRVRRERRRAERTQHHGHLHLRLRRHHHRQRAAGPAR